MNNFGSKTLWSEYTLGVCYYPEHWDESLWSNDLDRMLAAGIRVVRIAEFAWTIVEPEEGCFTFQFFDRFLDLCQKKGLKVIFGTPTATPPAWLTTKYPEVLNCDRNGLPYQHGGRRHCNYNSPLYRNKVTRIVTALGEHYGQHPAICGWQIDNEMNCETDEFYSAADTEAFRLFLRETYHDLASLNQAWGTVFWNQTYTAWEQICLPAHVLNGNWNPHQRLDYLRFISASTRSFCKLQADILRKYKKENDFITTNGIFYHIDNHRMCSESLDTFGFDSYPNFAFGLFRSELLRETGYSYSGDLNDRASTYRLSEVRSVCPHFMILEQQAGAGSSVNNMENPMPRPGQIKLWAMQSVAHGADFISFFRWRTCTFGTEIYWHGILDYDGRNNRRLAEVREVSQMLSKLSPLCGSDFWAPLALVRDYDNVWDAEVDSWHGRLNAASEAAILQQAQLSHVPCDLFYLSDDSNLSDLLRYPVLIYPHPAIMTTARATLLKSYVEQGGTLILGCRSGYKQENGQCVTLPPPCLLSEITGSQVQESSFQHPAEPSTYAEWDGEQIPAVVFQDILAPIEATDSHVLAHYTDAWFSGSPALIEAEHGAGRCIHWGSCFSRTLVKKLLSYTKLDISFGALMEIPEGVEVVERRKADRRFLILLNYLPSAQQVVFHNEVLDLLTGRKISGAFNMNPFGVLVVEI